MKPTHTPSTLDILYGQHPRTQEYYVRKRKGLWSMCQRIQEALRSGACVSTFAGAPPPQLHQASLADGDIEHPAPTPTNDPRPQPPSPPVSAASGPLDKQLTSSSRRHVSDDKPHSSTASAAAGRAGDVLRLALGSSHRPGGSSHRQDGSPCEPAAAALCADAALHGAAAPYLRLTTHPAEPPHQPSSRHELSSHVPPESRPSRQHRGGASTSSGPPPPKQHQLWEHRLPLGTVCLALHISPDGRFIAAAVHLPFHSSSTVTAPRQFCGPTPARRHEASDQLHPHGPLVAVDTGRPTNGTGTSQQPASDADQLQEMPVRDQGGGVQHEKPVQDDGVAVQQEMPVRDEGGGVHQDQFVQDDEGVQQEVPVRDEEDGVQQDVLMQDDVGDQEKPVQDKGGGAQQETPVPSEHQIPPHDSRASPSCSGLEGPPLTAAAMSAELSLAAADLPPTQCISQGRVEQTSSGAAVADVHNKDHCCEGEGAVAQQHDAVGAHAAPPAVPPAPPATIRSLFNGTRPSSAIAAAGGGGANHSSAPLPHRHGAGGCLVPECRPTSAVRVLAPRRAARAGDDDHDEGDRLHLLLWRLCATHGPTFLSGTPLLVASAAGTSSAELADVLRDGMAFIRSEVPTLVLCGTMVLGSTVSSTAITSADPMIHPRRLSFSVTSVEMVSNRPQHGMTGGTILPGGTTGGTSAVHVMKHHGTKWHHVRVLRASAPLRCLALSHGGEWLMAAGDAGRAFVWCRPLLGSDNASRQQLPALPPGATTRHLHQVPQAPLLGGGTSRPHLLAVQQQGRLDAVGAPFASTMDEGGGEPAAGDGATARPIRRTTLQAEQHRFGTTRHAEEAPGDTMVADGSPAVQHAHEATLAAVIDAAAFGAELPQVDFGTGSVSAIVQLMFWRPARHTSSRAAPGRTRCLAAGRTLDGEVAVWDVAARLLVTSVRSDALCFGRLQPMPSRGGARQEGFGRRGAAGGSAAAAGHAQDVAAHPLAGPEAGAAGGVGPASSSLSVTMLAMVTRRKDSGGGGGGAGGTVGQPAAATAMLTVDRQHLAPVSLLQGVAEVGTPWLSCNRDDSTGVVTDDGQRGDSGDEQARLHVETIGRTVAARPAAKAAGAEHAAEAAAAGISGATGATTGAAAGAAFTPNAARATAEVAGVSSVTRTTAEAVAAAVGTSGAAAEAVDVSVAAEATAAAAGFVVSPCAEATAAAAGFVVSPCVFSVRGNMLVVTDGNERLTVWRGARQVRVVALQCDAPVAAAALAQRNTLCCVAGNKLTVCSLHG